MTSSKSSPDRPGLARSRRPAANTAVYRATLGQRMREVTPSDKEPGKIATTAPNWTSYDRAIDIVERAA